MPPETAVPTTPTELAIYGVMTALSLLGAWVLAAIRKKYAVETKTTLDEKAIDLVNDILADLMLQLSPAVAVALADGKLDDAEQRRLVGTVESILGKAGLERLKKATGFDASGVIEWIKLKLGAKAATAKAEGLGPFMASKELSAKLTEQAKQ
jgi:hypothetical protein